jgi:type VII secretion-associated serine protease mycosin
LAVAVILLGTPAPAAADQVRDGEWHLAALGITEAQRISRGDGVIVAVTDTGVDDKHAELAGAVLPGRGFGEGNTTDGRFDSIGHGTGMAGLIAGRGLPQGGGMLGIAPQAKILPVQTLQGDLGVPTNLAAGINWASGQGAKVICIAAVTSEDPAVKTAVEAALRADVVVVAGVGNTPADKVVGFPARLPGILAVGGTDRNGNHATVSATGPEILVAAPAVDIVSTAPFGKYDVSTGTSNATAIVAGVVALVRARYPQLSGPEVVRRITATAVDKGPPGRDDEYGFGIVNPVAALTADLPDPSPAGSRSPGDRSSARGPRPATWVVAAAGAAAVVLLVAVLTLRRRTRRD